AQSAADRRVRIARIEREPRARRTWPCDRRDLRRAEGLARTHRVRGAGRTNYGTSHERQVMARPPLGFRILPAPPRLSNELVARFRGVASPNLADAMGRFHFMDPEIRSRSGLPLCGLAVTVLCRPADNLMVHKALQVAE